VGYHFLASALARPMPELAPVIKATFSANFPVMGWFSLVCEF
jgi:hypothetical protein